jgi:hypothetical protein
MTRAALLLLLVLVARDCFWILRPNDPPICTDDTGVVLLTTATGELLTTATDELLTTR